MELSTRILSMLNAQVGREYKAHLVYKQIQIWADKKAFRGLTKWAKEAADEELTHANLILDYLMDRSTAFMPGQAAPPTDFKDYKGALSAALALEQEVSQSINGIAGAAATENDWFTVRTLGPLLDEQVQSEKEILDYLVIVDGGAPIYLVDDMLFGD